MTAVTEARSVLVDSADSEQSRQITNSGSAAVEVSTDKAFRWGYGIRIGPGETEPVVLHVRERLYAMCAPGESSTVTVGAQPGKPIDDLGRIFEVRNLLVPAGTNLDNEPITVGTFDVDPFCSIVPALAMLTDVVPDPGLSLTVALLGDDGNALVPASNLVVVLGASNEFTDTRFEGITPVAIDAGQPSPNVPTSVVSAFGLEYDPVTGQAWTTDPPATVKLAVQLQGSGGPLAADVTVIRARATFLIV